MPEFVPAHELCRDFYADVLAPAIDPPHAAGLLGPGSDVLGYDDLRSTDHDWGPRALIIVAPDEVPTLAERISATLSETYHGWPLRIGRDGGPLRHQVRVTTLGDWLTEQLGTNPRSQPLTALDWLVLPQQRLLGIVKGAVFNDDSGELSRVRTSLAWYPDDVWWWLIACQWRRIAQEEPFVQRTAEVGDELGCAVVTARLARDCMRLALLLVREYAPYAKWLGTAVSRHADGASDGIVAGLTAACQAQDAGGREDGLAHAYVRLGRRFNELTPGRQVDLRIGRFHDRPARVIGADRFTQAALDRVRDSELLRRPLIGSIDQWVDSTDLLADPALCRRLADAYRRKIDG